MTGGNFLFVGMQKKLREINGLEFCRTIQFSWRWRGKERGVVGWWLLWGGGGGAECLVINTYPSLDVQILSLSITLSDPFAPSNSDLPFKRSGPRSHDSGSDSGSQPGSQTSEYTGIPLVHACSCSPSPCPQHSIRAALVVLMSVHGCAAAAVLVLVFGVCWPSSSLPPSISLHALCLQNFSLRIVYSSFFCSFFWGFFFLVVL